MKMTLERYKHSCCRGQKRFASLAGRLCIVAFALCLSFSCERVEVSQPTETTPVLFSAKIADSGTKGLIDNNDFCTKGTAIQVWDVFYASSTADPVVYIDGKYAVSAGSSSATWPFYTSGDATGEQEHYYWTLVGGHRFYGVLAYDASSLFKTPGSEVSPATTADTPEYITDETTSDWGWGYADGNGDSHVFYVPQPSSSSELNSLTLLPTSDQFDFVYSDIVTRDLDADTSTDGATSVLSAVSLEFAHLFSAFAFTFFNKNPSDLTLTDISLNAWGTARAEIDYGCVYDGLTAGATGSTKSGQAGASPTVTYYYGADGVIDSSSEPVGSIAGIASYTGTGSSASVGASATANLFVTDTEGKLISTEDVSIVWPQSLKDKSLEISFSTRSSEDVYSYLGSGSEVYYVSSAEYTPGAGNYVRGTYSSANVFTADDDQENGSGLYFCIASKEGGYGNSAGFGDWTLTFTTDADNALSAYKTSASGSQISYARTSTAVTRDEKKTLSLYGVTDSAGNSITEWEPGKKYIYSLTYTMSGLSLTLSILDWAALSNTVTL